MNGNSRHILRVVLLLIMFYLIATCHPCFAQTKVQKIDKLMSTCFVNGHFNGAVLVSENGKDNQDREREFNGPYFGTYLNRVAFPIGGIGAGMFCLEGTGAISHVSFRNRPEIFHEPLIFAALCVKGREGGENIARVIEGPIPKHKYFGKPGSGNGLGGTSYGLPRFGEAKFLARFPFVTVTLKDDEIPLDVNITGWSPFIPIDADNSSLPVGALEYTFQNPTSSKQDAVFSFNTVNFMATSNTLR